MSNLGLTVKVWRLLKDNRNKPDPLLPYLQIASRVAPIDLELGEVTPEGLLKYALELADLRGKLDDEPMPPKQELREPDGR